MKAKVRTFSGTTSNEITQREINNRALARKAAAEGFANDNPLANSASYQGYIKNVESQDKVVKEIE